ncbi:MAG: cupin domain-containing protein [Desulfurivibrionaceae bacterium]
MGEKILNIFQDIPEELSGEFFEDLVRGEDFVLERIVSRGQATPDGEWLRQERAEWVILLSGRAVLEFEDRDRVRLGPGDYLLIAAGERHRIAWTDPDRESVWLALHFSGSG